MGFSANGQSVLTVAVGGAFVLAFLLSLPSLPRRARAGLVVAGPLASIAALVIGRPERGLDRLAWVLIAGAAVVAWLAGAACGYFLNRLFNRP